MKTSDVFGISPTVRATSYVDRGNLDSELAKHLSRDTHVALRGESKCGKSWLRQSAIPNAIVVQCRLSKSVVDLYVDALSQLDIKLQLTSSVAGSVKGTAEAKGEVGLNLLTNAGIGNQANKDLFTRMDKVAHDVEDLSFVAAVIKASGRRLVIEDFHYMSLAARRHFAFDLKALWDYTMFVVIIGVWSESNMLLHLNPDLSGRVHELPIEWNQEDLIKVLTRGGVTLKLTFSQEVSTKLSALAFKNVGIPQKLALMTLDESGISDDSQPGIEVSDSSYVDSAAMAYAEQLNPLYQQFARNVSGGIRTRKNSTGIYAYAMAAILV